MRAAGAVVARCLQALTEYIVPGKTTTLDLDKRADELILEAGAVSAFKNYRGYPNTVCVAVNEEVVHGIPGHRVLQAGDIVGIDLGVVVDGWYSDSAVTVAVGGQASPEAESLLKVGREALFAGIEQARVGGRLSDIGHAIQTYAEQRGYSVVRDLVGHGIGRSLHEDPHVPNFGKRGTGPRLVEGMTLAIEPMINIGDFAVKTLDDAWTVVTEDGSLSAHFEHTVAVTGNGPDILTLAPPEEGLSVNG